MSPGNFFLKKHGLTIILCLVVLLFLLQRGALVLFAPSHVAHPYFDETVSGVLPCDILDGALKAPLFAYEYLNRSGDVLIEGLLLVPYFKVFGRSVFSTKLFALTSSLVALAVWIIFLKKYQGGIAALLFALLYALPPLTFARLNLLGTISSHHLICPLIAIQSFLLFKILLCPRTGNIPSRLWFFSGIMAGLGVYSFYTYAIFLSFCLLFFLSVNRSPLRSNNMLACAAGALIGFLPWILRSLSSRTGGAVLKSIITACAVDPWAFIQNFLFAVPHSLGYGYPSRSINAVSILFALLILLGLYIILKAGTLWRAKGRRALKTPHNIPPGVLQGLFCALFPVFFLVCLSLSPLRIAPFEYWPTFGLFATFGESDVIRYRWLHILFPFYFAAIAAAAGLVANRYRVVWIGLIAFFALMSAGKTIIICSRAECGKIFYYSGYNYDQFAPKFVLGEFAPRTKQAVEKIVATYPEPHRSEAYRWFGSYVAGKALNAASPSMALDTELAGVPDVYIDDIMYGIAHLAQDLSPQGLQPLTDYLIKKDPESFYRAWGFRYLGYKHYTALVNETVLFAHIPGAEQWFYKKFLNAFRTEIKTHTHDKHGDVLHKEIDAINPFYQPDAASGIGMLVGAEMLFDPLQQPDYPLDSGFGRTLEPALREAFYKGVGIGFAETLCRYWRRLMPPEADTQKYTRGLAVEWERCRLLMSRMPAGLQPVLQKGFKEEIMSRKTFDSLTQQFVESRVFPALP